MNRLSMEVCVTCSSSSHSTWIALPMPPMILTHDRLHSSRKPHRTSTHTPPNSNLFRPTYLADTDESSGMGDEASQIRIRWVGT